MAKDEHNNITAQLNATLHDKSKGCLLWDTRAERAWYTGAGIMIMQMRSPSWDAPGISKYIGYFAGFRHY